MARRPRRWSLGRPGGVVVAEPRDAGRPAEPWLDVKDLTVRYGGVISVDAFSMSAGRGEICGLIGPNGSGKSTTLGALSRLTKISAGRLVWRGRDYTSVAPQRVSGLGIARTFQTVRLAPSLSVAENVMAGADTRRRGLGLADAYGPLWAFRRREARLRETAEEALGQVGLAGSGNRPIGSLSYGQQRRVELARVLVADPELVLLDEPTAGMSEDERSELGAILADLASSGKSLVLVEHNLRFISRLCDWVYVLNRGRCIASGSPDVIGADPTVLSAYVGGA